MTLRPTGDARHEDEAARLRASITALERDAGANRAELATAVHRLATVLAATGDVDEAIATYERALAIKRAHLDATAGDLAITLHDLAVVYASIGRDDKAQPLWREATAALRSH